MKTAIYPGSFDPITNGHLEIARRSAKLFDKVIMLVSVNPAKPGGSFTTEERVEFIRRSVSNMGITNIEVDSHDGVLVDYFKEKNANAIVKGLRAMSDFENEFQMALVNRSMYDKAETVFLSADSQYTFLSSSMIKQLAMFGKDISQFVPECIVDDVMKRLRIR